jgi:hypothetical protein
MWVYRCAQRRHRGRVLQPWELNLRDYQSCRSPLVPTRLSSPLGYSIHQRLPPPLPPLLPLLPPHSRGWDPPQIAGKPSIVIPGAPHLRSPPIHPLLPTPSPPSSCLPPLHHRPCCVLGGREPFQPWETRLLVTLRLPPVYPLAHFPFAPSSLSTPRDGYRPQLRHHKQHYKMFYSLWRLGSPPISRGWVTGMG